MVLYGALVARLLYILSAVDYAATSRGPNATGVRTPSTTTRHDRAENGASTYSCTILSWFSGSHHNLYRVLQARHRRHRLYPQPYRNHQVWTQYPRDEVVEWYSIVLGASTWPVIHINSFRPTSSRLFVILLNIMTRISHFPLRKDCFSSCSFRRLAQLSDWVVRPDNPIPVRIVPVRDKY
jgi:hypothetical protein